MPALRVVPPTAVNVPGLRQRISDLEQQLHLERQRCALLEDRARAAYSVAAWGGARRTPLPEPDH